MSALDFRRLPPVTEKVRAPDRMNQTLLAHANICPRSAFLALKHRNQPATIEMDRGTAYHLFKEQMIARLVATGAASYFAPDEGEDPLIAAGEVASMTKADVEAVLRDRRDLVLPHYEREYVRQCAYHAALAWDVEPSTVAGIERLFVLDLDNGWTVSGKIDLLSLPDPVTAWVDDDKTSMAVVDQEGFDNRFQVKMYALLVMFGQPINFIACGACDGTGTERHDSGLGERCAVCKGKRGTEDRLPCIGGHLKRVRGRELYPGPKPRVLKDGRWELTQRSHTWTRQELADFRHDVQWVTDVIEHGLKTGDWPARYEKSHCGICPAEMECPLPRHLRRFAGALDSTEKAAEAWTWAERTAARVRATKAEVRKFAEAHDGAVIPLGNGREVAFETRQQRSVKRKGRNSDWDGLLTALEGAVNYGTPFPVEQWVPERPVTNFKERDALATRPEEGDDGRGDEGPGDADRRRDEQFGADAPF
jgi:hypothetical protein